MSLSVNNMTSAQIRKAFLDFFASKQHQIVASAPIVVKSDPTLMFINSGMAPFKDIFLGNQPIKYPRVADTQKCLRVSGKHNDLEEVGVDTYHHTMFEMLGNWSFGDYFKKDAIEWAWELLTKVYNLPVDRLYVTVFEGDAKENLAFDQDSYNFWKQWIPEDRILRGNKKDNFWEMGDTGPCGPCSEIHIDLRNEDERAKLDGKILVNESHPQVIEIWNNVFMEFNRKADGSLEKLPAQHVDTGMGFERLCMAMQGKQSNYDTDVFQPLIQYISKTCGIPYYNEDSLQLEEGQGGASNIAMRVMVDHIRAISFTIADGQLPSNGGAGYVIRRILRRAVRYGYTFLGFKEPFFNKLVPLLADQFADVFPELKAQQDFVQKVVLEEETSFLRTLGFGIQRFNDCFENVRSYPLLNITLEALKKNAEARGEEAGPKVYIFPGDVAFELYDTFGFPIDLTQLLAHEKGAEVDMDVFEKCLQEQKTRSRAAAVVDTDDWVVTPSHLGRAGEGPDSVEFVGYDELKATAQLVKYRKVKAKGKEQFQLVFDRTPFYAESGGQVGDTGYISAGADKVYITDTKKENNLIVHFADKLPTNVDATFEAVVDANRRGLITNNHSVTHLLHAALKQVLGIHVNQKGSLVNEDVTRFDFSHFAKVTDEELSKIETIVNQKVRENIPLEERRNVPIAEATKLGAMALFGEKYGDFVRVITFDKNFSIELCGGTHVPATGKIGMFKIVSESAVAAGVRRIEAITADKAEAYMREQEETLMQVRALLKNPKDVVKATQDLLDENSQLQKKIEALLQEKSNQYRKELGGKVRSTHGINLIAECVELPSADAIKNLAFELRNDTENLFLVLGAEIEGKAHLTVMLSDNLVKDKNLNASNIVRELAKEVQGGGGGQPFYATAGGKEPANLKKAVDKAITLLQ